MFTNTIVKGSILTVATVMAEGIAANQIETVILLGGGVAAVVGIVAWIESRIRQGIALQAAIDAERHKLVLEKIGNLEAMIKELKQ